MAENRYISIAELAKMLGISRIAVYKKVKKGDIKAMKVGRNYVISKSVLTKNVINIKGKPLTEEQRKTIERSVRKTVEEYGEVLKKLGNE